MVEEDGAGGEEGKGGDLRTLGQRFWNVLHTVPRMRATASGSG